MRCARRPAGRAPCVYQLRCGLFRRCQSGDGALVPAAVEPTRGNASRARDHAAHDAHAAARDPAADPDLWGERPPQRLRPESIPAACRQGRTDPAVGRGRGEARPCACRRRGGAGRRGAAVPKHRHAQYCDRGIRFFPGNRGNDRRAFEPLRRDSRKTPPKTDKAPPFRYHRLSQGVSRIPLHSAAGWARPRRQGRCVRMQQEINLLSKLPRGKRNVNARAEAKTDEIIAISRQYGELYFDGPRKYGYGGYRYDGRWIPVAEDMVKHFDLKPGDRVLDVGCGKGFLVKDLIKVCPGLEAFGLDISEYALM